MGFLETKDSAHGGSHRWLAPVFQSEATLLFFEILASYQMTCTYFHRMFFVWIAYFSFALQLFPFHD
jgi:hypothetical protein